MQSRFEGRFVAAIVLGVLVSSSHAQDRQLDASGEKAPTTSKASVASDAWQKMSQLATESSKALDREQVATAWRKASALHTTFSETLGEDHGATIAARWELSRLEKLHRLSDEGYAAWRKQYEPYQRLAASGGTPADRDRAVKLLEAYLPMAQQVFGESHPETASIHHWLGRLLLKVDQKQRGEGQLRVALKLRRTALGDMNPESADTMVALSEVCFLDKRHREVIDLLSTALKARLNCFGNAHESLPDLYTFIGRSHLLLNEANKAIPALESELALRSKSGESLTAFEAIALAQCLSALAAAKERLGRSREAEPHYRQVLELSAEHFTPNSMQYAQSLVGLADNLDNQGSNDQAVIVYRRALTLLEALVGETHPETARVYNNLAFTLTAQGKYAEALDIFEKALKIRMQVHGENSEEAALGFANLAYCLDFQGKYGLARPFHEKALALRLRLLPESHPNIATSYDNLAFNAFQRNDLENAESLFRKAFELRKQFLPKHHRRTALSYMNLAAILRNRGKILEAEPLAREAVRLTRQAFGDVSANAAGAYTVLGVNLDCQDRPKEAERHLRKALEIRLEVLGEFHSDTVLSYRNLAANQEAQGNIDAARDLLKRGLFCHEGARIFAARRGLDRAFFSTFEIVRLQLAVLEAREGNSLQAWQAAEANFGRGSLDELALRSNKNANAVAVSLAELERTIGPLVPKVGLSQDEQKRLAQLLSERADLQKELVTRAITASRDELVSLTDFQRELPRDAAYVFWVDVGTPDSGVAEHWGCVVRSEGEPRWSRLRSANADWTDDDQTLPQQLYAALSNSKAHTSEITSLADRLREQRIAPLLPHLDGVRRLYVVRSGRMDAVPIQLIAKEFTVSYISSASMFTRLRKVDRPKAVGLFALADPVFLPAKEKPGSTLLPPHGLYINSVVPGSAAAELGIIAGDVLLSYDGKELHKTEDLGEQIAAAVNDERKVSVWRDGRIFQRTFQPGKLGAVFSRQSAEVAITSRREAQKLLTAARGNTWRELPGSRAEVNELASHFGNSATLLLDERASESNLERLRKNGELSRFRYVHIASHGQANGQKPFDSEIVLAHETTPEEDPVKADPSTVPTGSRESVIDGRLTASEVRDNWDLNAELVTLSACESGLGTQSGGDGIMGFSQAFIAAGARAVCISLWEVDDAATSLLMSRFYENMLGKRSGLTAPMPKAEALREAKEWLRMLPRDEAESRLANVTHGIVRRGKGMKLTIKPSRSDVGEQPADLPYADPRFWSPFILVGDPN